MEENSISEQRTPFLVGEEADEQLREAFAGSDPRTRELAVAGNQMLDFMLKNIGIDPATMRRQGEEVDSGEH